jgi:multidrug efflux pump
MPLSQVEDLVDTRLAPKISQLNGVGLVSISGGQKPAVRIQANPDGAVLLRHQPGGPAHRADPGQRQRRPRANFDGPRQDYQIDANDQLVTSEDYKTCRRLPQRRAGDADRRGQRSSTAENNKQAAWMNQTPAVILNVQRQPGANTISVVKSIKQLLPQLQANLPTGIRSPRSPT